MAERDGGQRGRDRSAVAGGHAGSSCARISRSDGARVARQDASNQSDDYLRNRVRKTLTAEPRESFIALGAAAASWKAWVNRVAPVLEETFACRELADLALPIARVAAS